MTCMPVSPSAPASTASVSAVSIASIASAALAPETAVIPDTVPAVGAAASAIPPASEHSTNKLSRQASFFLLASITLSFLAGSSAPTPLYPIYQAQWGFSPVTVTLIFGVYAVVLLGALLVAGRLSDYLGRRPVLIAAALVQAVAMLVFATADGVTGLMIARIIQGLATGAAVAAIGAGMLDLDAPRGTLANSVAPGLGTALGGLIGGLMVHFLPAPTHAVYLFFAVVFVAQAAGVLFMDETAKPRPGALASMKPRFSVPFALRRPMLLVVPMLIAVWALAGFYGSLVPSLVHKVFGWDASLQGGVALFLLAGSGSIAVLLLRRLEAHGMLIVGGLGLLGGTAVIVGALAVQSAGGFLTGTVIAGAGFGVGFQAGMRAVMPLAAAHERAGVLSVIFVVSYLGMGLPAVVAGFVVVHTGNLLATAEGFGVVVMALAAFALAGAWAGRMTAGGIRKRTP